MDIMQIIEALQQIQNSTWLLVFLGLYIFGYMLKEHTALNNKLIPWFIVGAGVGLGYYCINKTLGGVIVGAAMAYIIIGFYEHIKNTFEYLITKRQDK